MTCEACRVQTPRVAPRAISCAAREASCLATCWGVRVYRGTSLIRNSPPPLARTTIGP